MKRLGLLLGAARNPVETILYIFSLSLFVYSIYVMSPAYDQDSYGAPVADALQDRMEQFLLGAVFFVLSLPGLIAPFINKLKRLKWLKYSSFFLFLAYTFLTILRLAIYGLTPVSWLNLFATALACGALRLYLEVKKD